jgi:hypothetical protein
MRLICPRSHTGLNMKIKRDGGHSWVVFALPLILRNRSNRSQQFDIFTGNGTTLSKLLLAQ